MRWINGTDADLAIIAGDGGMGKTTLCDYLYDQLNKEQENLILFINSKDLIESFKNNEIGHDIYKIYEKWVSLKPFETSKMERDVFITQLRVGNLILIFDGLDEVISTCEHFNLKDFFEGLASIIGTRQKSKIIVNLRKTYLNEDEVEKYLESNYKIFYVKEFDYERVKEYFESRFPNDDSKIKRALRICDKIVITQQNKEESRLINKSYPPYFLKIVGDIVKRENDNSDHDFYEYGHIPINEKYFDRNDINDIVINGLLVREESKKDRNNTFGLSTENQIKLLSRLAVSDRNFFNIKFIEKNCKELGFINPAGAAMKIWDHPLLTKVKYQNAIKFKYTFISNYLIAIGISSAIVNRERVTDELLYKIGLELLPQSLITKIVRQKIQGKNPRQKIKRIIKKALELDISLYEESISYLFQLALSFTEPTIEHRTNIMIDFFEEKKNKIRHLMLINIYDDKMIFDFKGLEFKDSKFKNYPSFFKCDFNKKTKFQASCEMRKVFSADENVEHSTASLQSFEIGIRGDDSHLDFFEVNSNEQNKKNKREAKNAIILLYEIISQIPEGTSFNEQDSRKAYDRRKDNRYSYEETIGFLMKSRIVHKVGDKLIIDDNTRTAMSEFIKDGFPYPPQIQFILDKMV